MFSRMNNGIFSLTSALHVGVYFYAGMAQILHQEAEVIDVVPGDSSISFQPMITDD